MFRVSWHWLCPLERVVEFSTLTTQWCKRRMTREGHTITPPCWISANERAPPQCGAVALSKPSVCPSRSSPWYVLSSCIMIVSLFYISLESSTYLNSIKNPSAAKFLYFYCLNYWLTKWSPNILLNFSHFIINLVGSKNGHKTVLLTSDFCITSKINKQRQSLLYYFSKVNF